MNGVERALVALLALPVIGLVVQAFGLLSGVSFEGIWLRLLTEPALAEAAIHSVILGIATLWLSLKLACLASFRWLFSSSVSWFRWLILAMPHSALGLGVLLFFGASGVWVRLATVIWPEIGPFDYLFPRDPLGIGALSVLVLKESLFLSILAVPVARQLPCRATYDLGRQAGLSDVMIYRDLLWPQVLVRLRAPILVVLAFAVSNLEVAMILGPDQPQFISVRILSLLMDPDPLAQSAGALAALLMLVALSVLGMCCSYLTRPKLVDVKERNYSRYSEFLLPRFSVLIKAMGTAAIFSLFLWAIAGYWSVEMFMPRVTMESLSRLVPNFSVIFMTLSLGILVAALSVGLAVGILEWMVALRARTLHWIWWGFIWMPALPLSAGFLGWLYLAGGEPGYGPTLVSHLVLATPYAMIVLAGDWLGRTELERHVLSESGISRMVALRIIWMPRHSPQVLVAFAISFSVSCALYTQTLLLGGGRVETLATELIVNLAGDRRSAAAAGLWNALLPWLIFGGCTFLGTWFWRSRLGMQGGLDVRVR